MSNRRTEPVYELTDGRQAAGLISSLGRLDLAIVTFSSTPARACAPGPKIVRELLRAQPSIGIVARAGCLDACERKLALSAGAHVVVGRWALQMLADGRSIAASARLLGLSAETVRTHSKACLSRLGAGDRAHAVAIAMRRGLID